VEREILEVGCGAGSITRFLGESRYSHESDATLKFLEHLKTFLAEDGFLIAAIENQLGLKYFSGFFEDLITELNDSQNRIQSLQTTVNNLNELVRGLTTKFIPYQPAEKE
jgi:hypothetical protein